MRFFALGLVLGISLMGCAGFSYKYYGLQADNYSGLLLGEKPKDDLPLKACEPDQFNKGKCIVILTDEFFRMKQDFIETKKQLIKCQEGK